MFCIIYVNSQNQLTHMRSFRDIVAQKKPKTDEFCLTLYVFYQSWLTLLTFNNLSEVLSRSLKFIPLISSILKHWKIKWPSGNYALYRRSFYDWSPSISSVHVFKIYTYLVRNKNSS